MAFPAAYPAAAAPRPAGRDGRDLPGGRSRLGADDGERVEAAGCRRRAPPLQRSPRGRPRTSCRPRGSPRRSVAPRVRRGGGGGGEGRPTCPRRRRRGRSAPAPPERGRTRGGILSALLEGERGPCESRPAGMSTGRGAARRRRSRRGPRGARSCTGPPGKMEIGARPVLGGLKARSRAGHRLRYSSTSQRRLEHAPPPRPWLAREPSVRARPGGDDRREIATIEPRERGRRPAARRRAIARGVTTGGTAARATPRIERRGGDPPRAARGRGLETTTELSPTANVSRSRCCFVSTHHVRASPGAGVSAA